MTERSKAVKRILSMLGGFVLILSLGACNSDNENPSSLEAPAASDGASTESTKQTDTDRQIQITTRDGKELVFALNDSTAASDLYDQLPLSVEVENFSNNEKIFYPPEKLNTSDAPLAEGPAGTLAHYAPWGDVAIYYGDCGGASGLYELGEAVSGSAYIADLTGKIEIEAVGASSVTPEPADSESSSAASQQAQSSATSQKPSSESQTVSQQTQSANSSQPPSSEAVASPSPAPSSRPAKDTSSEEDAVTKMNVQVDGLTFADTLADNAAVDSFVEMMQKAPVVINMRDYSGFEKAGALGTGLPTSNSQTTTRSGDIVLYNGNQIVIFYGSNSWSYTRLGKIDDLSGWEDALGGGDVTVTFSVD